jgi:hypothetical protein
MTDSEKDREPRDADPYDRPRGVRFSREESEWLEALADSMYSGQKGARRSFAAAIREALSWGMSVTRGEAGPRLRELAKALGLPLRASTAFFRSDRFTVALQWWQDDFQPGNRWRKHLTRLSGIHNHVLMVCGQADRFQKTIVLKIIPQQLVHFADIHLRPRHSSSGK